MRIHRYLPQSLSPSLSPFLSLCLERDGTQIGRQDHMAKCPTQGVSQYGSRLARKTNRPLGYGPPPSSFFFSRAHARSDRRPSGGETRCAGARVSQTCAATAGIHHERVRIQADKGPREAPIGSSGDGRRRTKATEDESNGTDPRRTSWRPWALAMSRAADSERRLRGRAKSPGGSATRFSGPMKTGKTAPCSCGGG